MFSYLSSPDAADGVGVAFTDREGGASTGARGSLNLGRTDIDDLDAVRRNGAVVRRALGVPTLVALNQVHGTDVQVVDEAFLTSWGGRPWGDDSWIGSAAGVPALPVADAAVTRAQVAAFGNGSEYARYTFRQHLAPRIDSVLAGDSVDGLGGLFGPWVAPSADAARKEVAP